MIRVMNIISDTNIGGAGRVLLNYLRYTDKGRFETLVALPKGSKLAPAARELGAEVVEIDGIADASMDIKAVGAIKKAIKAEKPDIVHTHGAMAGRIAARQCGCKVIFTRHSVFPVNTLFKKGPGRLVNKLVNEHYADRIIAVSPAAAENLTEAGISAELIDVVMNGVDAVKRRGLDECAVIRRDYGIEPGDFTVGILARIEEYKGHRTILEAVKRLSDEGRRIKLLIAGTGAYEDEVRRMSHDMGLDGIVTFTGFLSDVSAFLSVLDAQLNASWGTEATSMSLLEGFSMGVPAIISDYGGNPWLIEEGVNGYIFKTRDDKMLAEKIAELMDNAARREYMSVGAERIYRERFTGEIFAENLERVYQRVMEDGKNGK